MSNVEIKGGMVGSDAKYLVDGVEIQGVQKAEIIIEAGRLTKVMLFLNPAYVAVDTPIYGVESETAALLADAVADELGVKPFAQRIYDAIVRGLKGKKNE